jgi:hypothetical protein
MKRILLCLAILASLPATADARLAWRSPRVVATQRLVVRERVVVRPVAPVRRAVIWPNYVPSRLFKCVGGKCW